VKTLSLYLILFIITFLLIEICVRLFVWVYPVPMLFDAGYNRFRGNPNAMIYGHPLNSLGFKDEEFKPKEKGVYRIVGIGDSYTFGVTPYPDNFLTVAEKELAARFPEKKVEIYNMGIPSIGPKEEIGLLEDEGFGWEPDMVLINFFVGNDFQEHVISQKRHFVENYLYSVNIAYRAFTLLSKTSREFRANYMKGWDNYCDSCNVFTTEDYLQLEADRSFIFNRSDPFLENQLALIMEHFKKAKALCDEKGIELVVSIIPDEMQINQELQQAVIQKLRANGINPEWDNTLPNRRFAEELIRLGIPYIDFFPVIAEHRDTSCYVPQDSHWNIYGNRVAGEYLAGVLTDHFFNGE